MGTGFKTRGEETHGDRLRESVAGGELVGTGFGNPKAGFAGPKTDGAGGRLPSPARSVAVPSRALDLEGVALRRLVLLRAGGVAGALPAQQGEN